MDEEYKNYRTYTDKEWKELKGISDSMVNYGGNRENRYKDSHLIYARVFMAGKEAFQNSNINLTLKQEVNSHHVLELISDPDEFDERDAYLLENSRKYLGKKISVEFRQSGKTTSVFTGIITDISFRNKDGIKQVVFTAHSPTILMEGGIHQRSFENLSLEEIIQKVGASYPQDLVSFSLNPNLKDKLLYTVQQESDWEFIQRLSVRYGEYTFFNGTDVVVSPWGTKIIEINEQIDLFDYEIKMGIAPQQFSFQVYYPEQAQLYSQSSDSNGVSSSQNPFLNYAINASNVFTRKASKVYDQGSFIQNSGELGAAVQREVRKRQNQVYVEARTSNPSLRLGDVVKMNAWMPEHPIFKNGLVPIESYRIIAITHTFFEGDGYYNVLTAVPKDLAVPAYADEGVFPKSSVQHAVVTDNKDPKKMGRVRIQFPWQREDNQQTPWVQVVQPHAGADKGSFFNPEVGESVLAGFFAGNAERPFVLGTAYNGGEIAAYYTEGNDIKVIQTRSGTKIVFNDAEGKGSILIQDPGGNKLFMDGNGNISVNAPKNFSVNVGENMDISIGKNLTIDAGENITETAGKDIFQTATGTISESSEMRTEIVENLYQRESALSREISEQAAIFSNEENMVLKSGKTVQMNSAEKSNLF